MGAEQSLLVSKGPSAIFEKFRCRTIYIFFTPFERESKTDPREVIFGSILNREGMEPVRVPTFVLQRNTF